MVNIKYEKKHFEKIFLEKESTKTLKWFLDVPWVKELPKLHPYQSTVYTLWEGWLARAELPEKEKAKYIEELQEMDRKIMEKVKNKICKHCLKEVRIRNPSGFCDHLYYPDNCKRCLKNEL